MKAMILAAGLGTRLRPYSGVRPKPLFPVLGRPLILYLLDQLSQQGFGPCLVNAHYLREQLVDLLRHRAEVDLQLEEEILGTGGGLRLAAEWLASGPALVMNGDTLISCRLDELRDLHLASGARISLVVHDLPRFNNLRVDREDSVTAFRVDQQNMKKGGGERLLAFTGVQFLDPEILHAMPAGKFRDLIDYYAALVDKGEQIKVIEVRDHFWTDIGTPADYLALHRDLLTGKVGPWPEFLCRPTSPVLLGQGVEVGEGARFEEWAMVCDGAMIGDGALVRRSVIWPGARIAPGALVEDRIVVD